MPFIGPIKRPYLKRNRRRPGGPQAWQAATKPRSVAAPRPAPPRMPRGGRATTSYTRAWPADGRFQQFRVAKIEAFAAPLSRHHRQGVYDTTPLGHGTVARRFDEGEGGLGEIVIDGQNVTDFKESAIREVREGDHGLSVRRAHSIRSRLRETGIQDWKGSRV